MFAAFVITFPWPTIYFLHIVIEYVSPELSSLCLYLGQVATFFTPEISISEMDRSSECENSIVKGCVFI